MDDIEDTLAAIERSARSVGRVSGAIKVICAVMLAIAACMMLYALSRLGRHVDDFVGFGTIAVGLAALSLVFWSIATFHAAFGRSMRLAARLHRNVERLMRMQEHALAAAATATEGRACAGSGGSMGAARGRPSEEGAGAEERAPVATFVGARGGLSGGGAPTPAPDGGIRTEDAAAAERIESAGDDAARWAGATAGATVSSPAAGAASLPASTSAASAARGAAAPSGPSAAPAEPAVKQCPHCRGSIRADVLRCRHCMERV